MPFNWIDFLVIVFLGYEAYTGWEIGLLSLGSSFISLAIGLWFALRFNGVVASFLTDKFGIASRWSTVVGYIFIALVADFIVAEILKRFIDRIPKKIIDSKVNSFVGALVSVLNGAMIVAFILLVILALPLRGTIKKDIRTSKIGGAIVNLVEQVGGPIKASFDQVQEQAVKFFTVSPQSKETISLDVAPKSSDLSVDDAAERKMVDLVNAERAKVGASKLTVDVNIVSVARAHSRDMFERRYFSHVSPDGNDPADRMKAGVVNFTLVGENLAYAPDVDIAHTGLMNSPEHKKNILDPEFHRIGIGIISTDSFGIMVTQNFAN